MDSHLFAKWLEEKRVLRPLLGDKKRWLYIDNASKHKLTDAAKKAWCCGQHFQMVCVEQRLAKSVK